MYHVDQEVCRGKICSVRIAQVNVYFYPFTVGGVEWYVHNISRQLVKLGHEVDVFTTDGHNGSNGEGLPEEIDGIRINRLPLNFDLTYRLKSWNGLKEKLAEGDFDIIHTYDYAQPHTFTAINVGKVTHRPVAITVFDVHSLIPRAPWKQLPMKIIDRVSAQLALRKASKVLVRAPNLIPYMVRMGVLQDALEVTP